MSDKETENRDNNTTDKRIRYCTMCRRSSQQTDRIIDIPGGMSICADCMQKAMNAMDTPEMQNMLRSMNIPGMSFPGFGSGMPEQTPQTPETAKPQPDLQVVETAPEETKEPENPVGQNGQNEQDGAGTPFQGFPNIPGVHMIGFGDLSSLFGGNNPFGGNAFFQGNQQKKAQSAAETGGKEAQKKQMDIHSLPAPHVIKGMLDEFVIGQEHAKKVISVAVYNHYKRVFTDTMDEIEIEKSNVLMLGPTGCGKTYLVRTLAKLLDVPLAIADATALTEAGYIGDDIESVISKLFAASDNDIDRCQQGIVFIDEIDKIAKKKNAHQRDVSGESVQQGMLKLLEGSEVEVPVGASSKNAMVPMVTINTRNILFICGGAFPGLEDVIKERLTRNAAIGFGADLRDQFDQDPNILMKVTPEDLRTFGMIPEFIGRLPVICALESMTKEMLIRILREPKNAILKQYQKLLELDEVQLTFDEEALDAIAEKALERKTGARALRAIIEEFMLDIMYEVPKDENIGTVRITKAYIEHTGGPMITMRGMQLLTD